MQTIKKFILVLCSLGLVCSAHLSLGERAIPPAKRRADARAKSISKAVPFLRKQQNDNGSYSEELGPGITALVTTSLLRQGIPEQDPVIAKSLNYLEQFVQDDGGIYQKESIYRNYETSLAMMCFAECKAKRFKDHLERAVAFVKRIQWDDDEGHELDSPSYGGAGYGKHKRPDMSNTTFMIEAMKSAGVDENDPAMQRALIFISRCQNLETEHNTSKFASKINDGGFYYTVAAGGSSQAGTVETPNGLGLRSYGSMTYAGLKSMIYAGLDKDDPRVKAATQWISKNYSLDVNPGMQAKYDGLYYYYHTFAKSLSALGTDKVKDDKGVEHDWKGELIDELAKKQQKNGSWVNETSERWLEGDAELVTAYALLSLSYCK